ncbi:MAG: hypothetical protein GY838_16480 [bacterium]|nr:hypothetical protein [bacterium]
MRTLNLILILVLAAGTALAEPVVVKNGAEPAHGVKQIEMEELWRVGGADDEENFFGLVTLAEMGPDGLVYVMDVQLCQVFVYDEEGTLVKTLFRQGDGPGEIRQPRDMVIMPDGSVGLVQEFPGKIVRVDADGNPLPSIEPRLGDAADGGFVAMNMAEQRGGTFLIASVEIKPGDTPASQNRVLYLSTLNDEHRVNEPLITMNAHWDFTNFTYREVENLPAFIWSSAVGPDGRIYSSAERNAYRINVWAPDLTLERVIEREYTTVKRTADSTAWLRGLLEAAFAQVPFPVELELSDTEPDINWLNRGVQVDGAGNLWILPSDGTVDQPEGVFATYDVFTPDGKFDHQVQAVCEGDGTEDGIFILGEDRAMVIKGYVDATATMFGGGGAAVEEEGEEADPMEMIYYRIVR